MQLKSKILWRVAHGLLLCGLKPERSGFRIRGRPVHESQFALEPTKHLFCFRQLHGAGRVPSDD